MESLSLRENGEERKGRRWSEGFADVMKRVARATTASKDQEKEKKISAGKIHQRSSTHASPKEPKPAETKAGAISNSGFTEAAGLVTGSGRSCSRVKKKETGGGGDLVEQESGTWEGAFG